MKSLQKRLEKIEHELQPKEELPTAHVAVINEDGKVKVQRPNNKGSFELPNEKALDRWMSKQEMKDYECLRVIVLNSQEIHKRKNEITK